LAKVWEISSGAVRKTKSSLYKYQYCINILSRLKEQLMVIQKHSRLQKCMAVILSVMLFALVFAPDIALADTCEEGTIDGQAAGNKAASPLWIVAGVGCGCIGVGAAYLIKPSVPADRLVGMSPEYVVCYTEAYKNSARDRQVIYSMIGWGIWLIIYFAAIAPSEE
jgi:hypothetical protein